MDFFKKSKGITLIALVITIIILIILAGVSINLLIGSDGIIEKANKGSAEYKEESVKEKMLFLLAEYKMDKESNGTLLQFLQNKSNLGIIDEVVNNEDGTCDIIVNGYNVTIDESTLEIETIEEETQFRKETKGKAEFICVPETEYVLAINISINSDDSVKKYLIQYNTVDGNKQSSNWINYTQGTSFEVTNNGVVYGRIVNTETNEIGATFKKVISNIDKEIPNNAIIEFDTKLVNVDETIKATITQEDLKSGIEIASCKYILNTSEDEIGIDSTEWDTATVFSETPEVVDIIQSTPGKYYLHILSVDKMGNKKETISENIEFKGVLYYLNTSKFGWRTASEDYMKGWDIVNASYNTEFSTPDSAYVVKQEKVNVDQINKITFNFSMSTNNVGAAGTVEFGLAESPGSTDFVCGEIVPYSNGNLPSVIVLDTSNITGDYYIKIILKETKVSSKSILAKITGSATIIGE